MKSINTLVDDIYGLFDKETVASEEEVEKLGRSLTDMLKRRLSVSASPRGLSMSNFGSKCKRQLWYKVNKPELAEPLEPKARLNFLAGDIWEEILLFLAKVAGHKVEGEQDELNYNGLKGHRDAVIDGVTVDVKTANSRSIEKFRDHKLEVDDPFGYLEQLGLYVEAAKGDPIVVGKREGAFLVADKERGGLYLDRYRLPEKDYAAELEGIRALLDANDPPQRRYFPEPDGKSGNQVICMQCRYCPFKEECWKDTNGGKGLLKYIFSTGPKWFTKIVRDPKPRVSQDG
jgi:hypothetical protein